MTHSAKEIAAQLRRFADELDKFPDDVPDAKLALQLKKISRYVIHNKPSTFRWMEENVVDRTRLTLVRIGLNIGLFKLLAKAPPTGSTIEDMAIGLQVDPQLLLRIVRTLVATGDIIRTPNGHYKNSSYSQALGTTWLGDAAYIGMNVVSQAFNQFPILLKETNYQNPTDTKHTGSHAAFGGKSFFEHINADPELLKSWNISMSAHENPGNAGKWFELFPVQERLLDGYNKSLGPLFVDVGGGNERRAKAFLDSLPHPYQMVVQDLPTTIAQAEKTRQAPDVIDLMAHDFFKPQPINGARCYYLRQVLHDWPDAEAKSILQNIHSGMIPGYSRLIIDDFILNEDDLGLEPFMDITMMVLLSGKCRTAEEWQLLLKSAGFRIIKIWTNGARVIEAEPDA